MTKNKTKSKTSFWAVYDEKEWLEKVKQFILDRHDYEAIPGTDEYANGWNDSRKRSFQYLKLILDELSKLFDQEEEREK